MGKRQYGKVNLLLVDPDLNIRQSIWNILHDTGFRDMHLGTNLEDIHKSMALAMPDILITDAELSDGDICDLIRGIRHNQIGSNPFVPIIALTWQPTRELVQRIVGSGADDLLTKPISTGHLLDRIDILVNARKPFVVTSDYIGPDRRTDTRAKSEIPQIEVPNSLRAKVTGDENLADLQAAIDSAIGTVNLCTLERYAHRMTLLVDAIAPELEKGNITTDVTETLEQLIRLAEDTRRRMVGTGFSHISELCRSMINVTGAIHAAGGSPSLKDIKLLTPLAQAIHAGFTSDDTEAAHEISASLRK